MTRAWLTKFPWQKEPAPVAKAQQSPAEIRKEQRRRDRHDAKRKLRDEETR